MGTRSLLIPMRKSQWDWREENVDLRCNCLLQSKLNNNVVLHSRPKEFLQNSAMGFAEEEHEP